MWYHAISKELPVIYFSATCMNLDTFTLSSDSEGRVGYLWTTRSINPTETWGEAMATYWTMTCIYLLPHRPRTSCSNLIHDMGVGTWSSVWWGNVYVSQCKNHTSEILWKVKGVHNEHCECRIPHFKWVVWFVSIIEVFPIIYVPISCCDYTLTCENVIINK